MLCCCLNQQSMPGARSHLRAHPKLHSHMPSSRLQLPLTRQPSGQGLSSASPQQTNNTWHPLSPAHPKLHWHTPSSWLQLPLTRQPSGQGFSSASRQALTTLMPELPRRLPRLLQCCWPPVLGWHEGWVGLWDRSAMRSSRTGRVMRAGHSQLLTKRGHQ